MNVLVIWGKKLVIGGFAKRKPSIPREDLAP